MVKVEGAKNFGIGLGLIVEDALFAVRLDFTIFQVEIECEGSIFLHDDQVTVIDLGCPMTEQHAAGGNTVLLITCLLYTSPSPRDGATSRMPSSA